MSEHISVCMCVYNGEAFLANAIKSVLNQSYKDFQLYVVDDGSDDNTLSVARQFVDDPRVTVIHLHKNIGTYAAKNLVLKQFASGSYWAHHDADDESLPERFEKEIAYLKENNLDGCGTAIYEIYEPGIVPRIPADEAVQKDESTGYIYRNNIYPLRVTKENVSIDIEDLPKLKIAMNGSLLFKLSAVQDLGGFDGETRFGGDSDFLWRFVKFYNFGNMPEVLYKRRFHSNSLTQKPETNHSSPARKIYAEKILKKHFEALDAYDRGERELSKQMSTYTMYAPEVEYTLFDYKSK